MRRVRGARPRISTPEPEMSIDAIVFLKFAAILGGLVWLSRRAARQASGEGDAKRD